ncbi:MAG TPA: hypothetical protein VFA27_05120 [Vicinamibacterales bacterium]|nr:hypothetical protein [Vicinamibacterales bacterium]
MGTVPGGVSPRALIRGVVLALGAIVVAAAAIYLHDPPWVATLTTGFRPWAVDGRGERFRWTMGRGSFFVPSDATAMTLKVRSHKPFPPNPITVDVRVDDRPLTVITLPDPRHPDPDDWVVVQLPLPRGHTSRHFRRVDLRVRHWLDGYYLGVHLGEVVVERP